VEKILKFLLVFLILISSLKADFAVKSYQELKNQKVVRQNYEQSCGAASLATLINLLDNKNLSELDLLKLINQQELYTDMVSFADLSQALEKLSYKAYAYKMNKEILDQLVNIPMLVKIEDDPRYPHFVVIINQKGNYLQVLDPSHGEYISSKKEFFNIWDRYNKGGYVLIVAAKTKSKSFEFDLHKTLHFDFKPFSLY